MKKVKSILMFTFILTVFAIIFCFNTSAAETVSSGADSTANQQTWQKADDGDIEYNFNKELIDRSVKTQEELLTKALKILKAGGEMVYSTCSILQEENENILDKVLKEFNIEIIPIEIKGMEEIPTLPTKIKGTLCVCPNKYYEGFFVAKIRKNR